jgi:hypothetical protein
MGVDFWGIKTKSFTVYFDPATNQSTADASISFTPVSNQRPCWTEPASTSGFIFQPVYCSKIRYPLNQPLLFNPIQLSCAPYIPVVSAILARPSLIQAILAQASSLSDMPGVEDEIIVIWQSDAIIPNTNISYLPHLNEEMQQVLTQAFLEIAATEDGLILLTKCSCL